jgi:hypothetical protein
MQDFHKDEEEMMVQTEKKERLLTCEPLHARVGTPAACAMSDDPILSPRAPMGPAGGPRNRIPRDRSVSGSSGTSDACPHPGHTAVTPVLSAICKPKMSQFHSHI